MRETTENLSCDLRVQNPREVYAYPCVITFMQQLWKQGFSVISEKGGEKGINKELRCTRRGILTTLNE
jgi:hypothetical protein